MTTRRKGTAAVLALAAVLTLAGARPAAALPGAGLYEDLWERAWGWWAELRWNVWQGPDLDPNGAPKPGLANVWAEQGPGWDPNGKPAPVPGAGGTEVRP